MEAWLQFTAFPESPEEKVVEAAEQMLQGSAK
jgi:hypothetical protein